MVIAAILLSVILSLLAWQFPYAIKDNWQNILMSSMMLLAAISSLTSRRFRTSDNFRNVVSWLGLFLIVILAYSFKDRLTGALMPNQPVTQDDGSLVLTASVDGHFYTQVLMNGQKVNCLVDTGASSIVVDYRDAAAIGIDVASLEYNMPTSTANGRGYSAEAMLSSLQIAQVSFNDVPISVNKAKMDQCLLGMSFLNRLSGFEISGDKLSMRVRR